MKRKGRRRHAMRRRARCPTSDTLDGSFIAPVAFITLQDELSPREETCGSRQTKPVTPARAAGQVPTHIGRILSGGCVTILWRALLSNFSRARDESALAFEPAESNFDPAFDRL